MEIIVRDDPERDVHLRIPTGLIFNWLSANLAPIFFRKSGIPITRRQAVALVAALHACRRRHPGWILVEVRNADGGYVEVRL